MFSHDAILHFLQEKEPMGTAGPLALANEILNDGSGDPFFVLNRWAAVDYSVKHQIAWPGGGLSTKSFQEQLCHATFHSS